MWCVNTSVYHQHWQEEHLLQKEILLNTKWQYMKEPGTPVGSVSINQVQREILQDMKGQYMKELDTLVGNATTNQLQRNILVVTKEQYTKE